MNSSSQRRQVSMYCSQDLQRACGLLQEVSVACQWCFAQHDFLTGRHCQAATPAFVVIGTLRSIDEADCDPAPSQVQGNVREKKVSRTQSGRFCVL